MSTVAMRTRGGSTGSGDQHSGRTLVWWAAVLLGLAVLAVFLAWLLGWFRVSTDPRVREILQLQEEARQKFMAQGGPQNLAEATEAVAAMGTIRQKVESLPEPLQEQVQQRGGSMFRSMMRAQIDAYFAAPADKRKEELDRQIRQEEMMRKAFEAARTVGGFFGGGGPPGGGGGPPGGGGPGGGQAAQGGQGGGTGGGPGGQAGGPQQATAASPDERRNVWLKRILDTTTPEQRARYVEYRRAKEVRRAELGLPASPWGR